MSATACATVRVSWDGTSAFDGPHDDVTRDVAAEPGLTIDYGKDGARTLDPPKVTAVDFELFNGDGRYSQERPDSPLYQRVLPGRPIDVRATLGTADAYRGVDAYRADDPYRGIATYPLASAAIDDIAQRVAWGDERVAIAGLGLEQVLVAATVTVGLMVAPRVDQCVTAILDAVGWPSTARAVSICDTRLALWWCDDREPWTALVELLLSEGAGAAMYVERGVFHFENRGYRAVEPRSDEPQAVFYDVGQANPAGTAPYRADDAYRTNQLYRGTTSGLWFTDLTYDPGFRNIRNAARYATRTRQLGADGTVVWTYGAVVELAAGASITLIARPSDPFQDAIAPVAGVDFTVAGGTVAASISAASGFVAFVTLTATSGVPTVSGLQLRARPWTLVGETTVVNRVDASESIARFSPVPGADIPRVFDVDGWPEIAQPYAEAVCDSWVTRYMLQRPAVAVTVVGVDDGHARQVLERTISDRIRLVERRTGLQADVWINGKTLAVGGAAGRHVAAVLRCEKCEELAGFVWDGATSLWDTAIWGG